jgi:hypothetical protein
MEPSSAASDASREARVRLSPKTAPAAARRAPGRSPGASRSVRIYPRSGWQPIDLAELWRFRELLAILAMRDIRVRYKQTVLGAAWAVIQPVLTMIVFSIFFGNLAG